MKKPVVQLTLGDEVVPLKRFISGTLTDNRALELDTFELILSDFDGKLAIPRKGVKVNLQIGYEYEKLIDRGSFIVDTVGHSGPPDTVKISCKSGNFDYSAMKTAKKKSYHKITIGQLINDFATEYDLKAKVDERLAKIVIDHIDQADESNANLITRLAVQYDAVATIKAGTLIFLPHGKGATADGTETPTITITRNDQDTHDWNAADRSRYTGVVAKWWHSGTKNDKTVKVGNEGNMKQIQIRYATEAEARTAAQTEWQKLQRELATIRIVIADAPPNIFAESILILNKWNKKEIDRDDWLATQVAYSFDNNGISCSLNAETRI